MKHTERGYKSYQREPSMKLWLITLREILRLPFRMLRSETKETTDPDHCGLSHPTESHDQTPSIKDYNYSESRSSGNAQVSNSEICQAPDR